MNKAFLLFIVLVVIGGVVLSGFLVPAGNKSNEPAVSTSVACVDHDPPDTNDTITRSNGIKFDLIKEDARVIEKYKFEEMGFLETINGKKIYSLGADYFGDKSNPSDLVFVLQNLEDPPKSPYIFKIYLKEGVAIPDYIKNCKSTGGTIQIVAGDTANFPPDAFNKTDIIGLLDSTVAPAYVYDRIKNTLSFINGLGAKMVGSLKVSGKNNNLPLYFHLGTMYLVDGNDTYEYLQTDKPVDLTSTKKTLQLKKIVFVQTPSYSWWTPACKPAIYLYPQKKQNVNVKVNTTGYFTLTIPAYNSTAGWNVEAFPDGNIIENGISYPYLYYESNIPDSKISKPDKGFITTKDELPGLLNHLLSDLGLNDKEAKEFKDYWQKVLPDSPYYFVGVMSKESIDDIEPLTITPKPDGIIRVRLYFEMLDKPISVPRPRIITPQRNGFTVVEWGGMVKMDHEHPFTCSQ